MAAAKRVSAVFMAVFGLLAGVPAQAETTAWAVNEGGRMRVTALAPAADGTVQALLEIEPKPGWITYWREPGGSGIPPQISLSGGASLAAMAFPVPKVLMLGALIDIGYDAPVAFPLVLKHGGGPAQLDAFIGICNEICIPFQASFTLSLAGPSDPAEALRLAAARATLPAAPSPAFGLRAARLSGEAMMLDLALPAPAGETEAILAGPDGMVFTARGSTDRVSIPLTGLPKDIDARSQDWRVLLKNGDRAIETAVEPE